MIVTRIILLTTVSLFAGCASVESFQAMHPYERAEKVCHGSRAYSERQSSIELATAIWQEQSALASRGYKIVETCQMVEVPSGNTTCRDKSMKDLYGNPVMGAKISCTESTVKREQCTQTPIPIDADRAERKAQEALFMAEDNTAKDKKLTGECIVRVMDLSPEDAYMLYKADLD